MANKLIHKRSSVVTDNMPKLPQANGLEFGEIAINYADGFETISFKNSENEIVEIRTKEYFENIINNIDVPTKLSDLANDVPFVSQGEFNSLYNTVNSKQDNISDLEDIRQGASLGMTALQKVPDEYITETELDSKGYLTEHQDVSHLATKEEVNEAIQSKVFIGTQEEYNTAYAAGKIAVGALVIIMEEGEDVNDAIALLGTAVLGKMILGQK